MKKAIYIVIIVILLIVFGVSAYMVGSYLIENKQQQDMYSDLSSIKEQAKPTTEPTESTEETLDPHKPMDALEIRNEDGILLEYAALYEMNPDMVGWIQIEGTPIDYPVMQTEMDNKDFYLYRNFEKQQVAAGSIYVREECDVNEPSDNVTIYGHNMRVGTMFAYLHNYIEKEEWEKNPLIFFDTLTDYHTYKIFGVFKTTASIGEGFTYHQMEWAEDEEDFNQFIATIKDLSFYDTGITPVYGDKIICLSTCEYTLENGRLVVAAYRIS